MVEISDQTAGGGAEEEPGTTNTYSNGDFSLVCSFFCFFPPKLKFTHYTVRYITDVNVASITYISYKLIRMGLKETVTQNKKPHQNAGKRLIIKAVK